MKKKIPLIVVCGPTASGKTSLAIEIAKIYNGEVVSADSMQIYKGMNIGTAKPDLNEMQGIVHHMLDIADIESNFSVSDYCDMAHDIIENIHHRGKLPIVAGGTGLYIDSLINDINFAEGRCNSEVRDKYAKLLEQIGAEKLHELLQSKDSEAAAEIHANNTKRVIRALEHIEMTGQKFSSYKKKAAENESRYKPLMIFIETDRQVLYDRINQRVDMMMDHGLLEEAQNIYDCNYNRELTAMCAIGYKELFDCFDGDCTIVEAVERIKQNSRRYAKRQLTWFRRNEKLHRIESGENMLEQARCIISKWLKEQK